MNAEKCEYGKGCWLLCHILKQPDIGIFQSKLSIILADDFTACEIFFLGIKHIVRMVSAERFQSFEPKGLFVGFEPFMA